MLAHALGRIRYEDSVTGRFVVIGYVLSELSPLTTACLLLVALTASAEIVEGRVVGVADGDTITVLDGSKEQHRVRLQGIDAPEKGQAFGQKAKEAMSRLVFGKEIRAECPKSDRYGRLVCTVWVRPPDCPTCGLTLDAGLTQVTMGLAWHYKAYEREQSAEDRAGYANAEIEARGRRAGLWNDKSPTPPWEWRATQTKK